MSYLTRASVSQIADAVDNELADGRRPSSTAARWWIELVMGWGGTSSGSFVRVSGWSL